MSPRSQDKRVWLAGGAGLAVLISVIGWGAVINPKLSSTDSLRGEVQSVQVQNTELQTKIAALRLAKDNVAELTASLQAALGALPFDSGLPAFTRQLSKQATQSKVVLTSVAVGTISAVPGTAAATTGTTAATGATAATATTGTTLVAIPITLLTTGTETAQLAFLTAIQVAGPRRALVSSTTLGVGSDAGAASIDHSAAMTTQMTIFAAPLGVAGQAALEKLLKGN